MVPKLLQNALLPFGGIFASFLIVAGYFGWQYFLNPDKGLLSEEIRSSRIAVLPFENKTNDPDLDMLGDMAADWITEGLMNLEDTKVVSFRNIKVNISFASEGNFTSFAKATGSEKIIRGNFYLDGDQIIFQSRIVDAESGVLEKAMPQISGNIEQKTVIVKNLQQRILGYFAIKTDPYFDFLKDDPPNFEAYKMMVKGYEYFNADYEKTIVYDNKAIEIDSNFIAPYLSILIAYNNAGRYWKVDSVAQVFKQRKLHLTPLDQLVYDKTLTKDPNVKIAISKKIFEIDPKNRLYNYDAANYSIIYNDPEESVRICQNVDLDLMRVEFHSQSLWFHVYAIALTRLNRFEEALDVLNRLPEKFEDFYYKTMVFALQGKEDSIQQMAQRLEKKKTSKDISWFYNRAALIYGVLDDKPRQKEWAGKALNYLKQQPEAIVSNNFNLARAYYLSEQYDQALSYYFELSRDAEYGSLYDDKGLWNYLSRIGCIYARTGKKEKAMEMIEQLKTVPDPYPEGRYSYGIARIYAQLNEKEKAMEICAAIL